MSETKDEAVFGLPPEKGRFPHPDTMDLSRPFKEIWEEAGLLKDDLDPLLTGIGVQDDDFLRFSIKEIFYVKSFDEMPEHPQLIFRGLFVALYMVGVAEARANPLRLKEHYLSHTDVRLFPSRTRKVSRLEPASPAQQRRTVSIEQSLEDLTRDLMLKAEFSEHLGRLVSTATSVTLIESLWSKPLHALYEDAPDTFGLALQVLQDADIIEVDVTALITQIRARLKATSSGNLSEED